VSEASELRCVCGGLIGKVPPVIVVQSSKAAAFANGTAPELWGESFSARPAHDVAVAIAQAEREGLKGERPWREAASLFQIIFCSERCVPADPRRLQPCHSPE
jgi:hypothetical protein